MNEKIYNAEIEGIAPELVNVEYGDSDLLLVENVNTGKIDFNIVRFGFNTFILCTDGKLRIEVGGIMLEMCAGQMFVCPSATLLNIISFSDDFKCIAMGTSDALLRSAIHPYEEIWNRAMYVTKSYLMNASQRDIDKVMTIYIAMKGLVEMRQMSLYKPIMHSQVQTILLYFCSFIQDGMGEISNTPSPPQDNVNRAQELFTCYLDLLKASPIKRGNIESYAQQLYVSSKYLSKVCKDISGKTAFEWMKEYLNQDINYLLLNTLLSIKEIANKTGFPDMSSFGKYMRREMGCSPQAYRKNKKEVL